MTSCAMHTTFSAIPHEIHESNCPGGNRAYLANVEIETILVDLGIVGEKDGRIDTSVLLDGVAGVVERDDVGRGAVVTLGT